MIYDPSENKRIYSLPEEKLRIASNSFTRAAYLLEYNLLLIVSESHSYVIDTSGIDEWQQIKMCTHS